MKNILLLLLILGISGCSNSIKQSNGSLSTDLYKHIDTNDKIEGYKACVLLGEIVLNDDIIKDLRARVSNTSSKNICHYYLLAKRSGEQSDIIKYIEVFPSGKPQAQVWSTHFDAGFPVNFSSPYFVLLAVQARHSDKALDKLISGLPYADASFGETLIDTIANIYKYFPERVLRSLKRSSISESDIKLITETANYQTDGK